jgi:hypothetical protein
MNAFPILAALTIGISFVILRASFEDLREAPLALDVTHESNPLRDERDAIAQRLALASAAKAPAPATSTAGTIYEANEGLLDHELASEDPINAWLSRYLTPAAD